MSEIDLRLAARKQWWYLEENRAPGTHPRILAQKKDLPEADRSLKLVVGDARLERATSGSGDILVSNNSSNLGYLTHQIVPNFRVSCKQFAPYLHPVVAGI